MFRLALVLALLWAVPSGAVTIPQSLNECNALCAQYFPGGVPVTPPATPPATPPVTPPSGNKTFPHPITFERETTQGNGAAGILLRTLQAGSVIYVSVNGEVARQGTPYKGAPVFLLTKSGDQYARPLSFVIKMADGQTYTAKSGTAGETTGPVTPGAYKNSKTYSYYNVANGRQAWRIPVRGDSLGPGPIKFTFSSGKTFTVPSTTRTCRDREDTCNRDSRAAMYGFVYKGGNGKPNGKGDADQGTSHGGIYLHAPFKDTSKSVTVQW